LSEALSDALAARGSLLAGTREPLFLEESSETLTSFPAWLASAMRLGLLVGMATLVALWLARAVRRHPAQTADPSLIGREIEMSRGEVAGDVAGWVGGLFRRVTRVTSGRGRRETGVRALYHAFLRMMAELGSPRGRAVTPWEFAPVAARALGGSESDVESLTDAYVRSRYGESEPEAGALAELERVAGRVRAAADAGRG
jgi:hypothetical protein